MTLPIYVLNGPSLNLLGTREPEVYGRTTLAEIEQAVAARARSHGLTTVFRQSNHEGELVDWVQEARVKASGLVVNAAAFSHTSVALLDALRAAHKPIVEVHLSNPYRREAYRQHSYVSETADAVICGLKMEGYLIAVDSLAELIKANLTEDGAP
jgi:3-dehydroquinate dehydratase II